MRRLLPPMLAAAALLAAPAAHADDVYFDVSAQSTYGSVRSTTTNPAELRLERGGQIIASVGPATSNRIEMAPQPGDVAHLLVNGAEKAAVPFDGRPTIDDSCSRVGTTTITGSWQPGDNPPGYSPPGVYGVIGGPVGPTPGSSSYAGDRYTVTFPRPIDRDEGIQVTGFYRRVLAGGETIGVTVARSQRVCPVFIPAKAVISGPANYGKRRVGRDRRLALPKLAIACPGPGAACDADVRLVSHELGVLGLARYKIAADGRRTVRARLFTRGMRQLKRRRAVKVVLYVGVSRSPAAGVAKKVQLRLLAPRPKRKRKR